MGKDIESKFKKHDTAYRVEYHITSTDVMMDSVGLVEIYITEVIGKKVKGRTLERYGNIKKYAPYDLKNITSKRKKKKGQEVDFEDNEFVAIEREYNPNYLLNHLEAKMKMIQYIVNNFQTEEELIETYSEFWRLIKLDKEIA